MGCKLIWVCNIYKFHSKKKPDRIYKIFRNISENPTVMLNILQETIIRS